MKRFLWILGILFLSGPSQALSFERWTEVTYDIPESQFQTIRVSSQETDDVYVGTSKTLYQMEGDQKTWKELLSIRGDRTTLYAIERGSEKELWVGTAEGLYHTQNQGKSWERISLGVGDATHVLSILLVRESEQTILIGTGNGLFQSHDGVIWNKLPGNLSHQEILDLKETFFNKTLYAATPLGLYRSQDQKNWERVFITNEEEHESTDEVSDLGEEENATEAISSIAVDQDKRRIYISTSDGVYSSLGQGSHWTKLTHIGLRSPHVNYLHLQGGALYAATSKGVFQYQEDENKWRDLSQGLTQGNILRLDGRASLWAVSSEGIFKRMNPEASRTSWRVEAKEVLLLFQHEPSIREIQEAAIRYAEVYPEKILEWRNAASRKAWLPKLTTGMDMDVDRNVDIDRGGTNDPDFFILGPEERKLNWDVSLTWDLGELIWNGDQTSIDVRSKLMVQLRDDVLDEVTRLYFERRRLQIELSLEPPIQLKKKVESELRLQELTADIDALTGGYLSKAISEKTI